MSSVVDELNEFSSILSSDHVLYLRLFVRLAVWEELGSVHRPMWRIGFLGAFCVGFSKQKKKALFLELSIREELIFFLWFLKYTHARTRAHTHTHGSSKYESTPLKNVHAGWRSHLTLEASSVQRLFHPPVFRSIVRNRHVLHIFTAGTVSSSQRRVAAKFASVDGLRCAISKNEYIPTEGAVFLGYGIASLDDSARRFEKAYWSYLRGSNVRRKLALVKGSSHFAKNLFIAGIRGCRRAPFDIHETLQCPLLTCW
jgi:hypothetical protein